MQRAHGELKAAIEYLQQIGFDEIKRREEALTSRALEGLKRSHMFMC